MAKYKRYPMYKPSGIEWLGDVPEGWELKKLRYLGDAILGLTYSPEQVVEEEDGVLVLRSSNVQEGEIVFTDNVYVNSKIPEKLITQPGDILICSRNGSRKLIGKNALIKGRSAGITFGAFMTIFRSPHYCFLYYVLNSSLFDYQSGLFITSTINQLTVNNLYSFLVPLPSSSEQITIASFLDRKTSKIDTLISKKQQLIEKLKEQRTALISHTVTKGLPPEEAAKHGLLTNPKYKPSGVEWLGDVPEGWKVTSVARLAKRVQTGGTPPTSEDRYYEDGTVPWFGPGSFDGQISLTEPVKFLNEVAIKDGVARLFKGGSTFIITIGATVGKVSSIIDPASCNQQITVVEFNERSVHARFITYQIKCLEATLRSIAPSATLPILSQNEIRKLEVALPGLEEQQIISSFLDRETIKIDTLVSKVEQAILCLKEFRTALISAAVTGKIDVREEVECPA